MTIPKINQPEQWKPIFTEEWFDELLGLNDPPDVEKAVERGKQNHELFTKDLP